MCRQEHRMLFAKLFDLARTSWAWWFYDTRYYEKFAEKLQEIFFYLPKSEIIAAHREHCKFFSKNDDDNNNNYNYLDSLVQSIADHEMPKIFTAQLDALRPLQLALNNLEYEWQGTDEVEERFLNVI
jgi:hypothetical protein